MFATLSLKWKVLALALAGPAIVALALSVHQVFQIRADAEESIVEQSRAVVLMAESAREEMAKKLEMGLTIPFDQITSQDKLLEAIPVITAINMAKRKADELNFKFRVPKVAPRNPANKPTPLEKSILDEFKANNLTEKVIVENHQIRYFRPIRLTRNVSTATATPRANPIPRAASRKAGKRVKSTGHSRSSPPLIPPRRGSSRPRSSPLPRLWPCSSRWASWPGSWSS